MTERERDRDGDDLRIDVVYQERVNLAMQQNAVPIVQSVRLTNSGAVDLHDVVIALRTEPQIAHAHEIRVERLGAGTSCEFSPVDLPLDAELLVRQIERERGALHVRVTAAGDEVATTTCPLEVLAYDEWSGTAALQEILAAYVLPNHPDVERVLMSARDILAERTKNPSLDGYQSQSPRRVHAVVGAIYEAIRRLEVTYVNPPASFEISGQKVRTPDRIMAARMGTCLDLTLLIAACIEQSGLHALVFLKEGHAWAGAWLEEETFATPALAEALAIRKRIDLDLICAIETTCLATRPQGSFATALAAECQVRRRGVRFLGCRRR